MQELTIREPFLAYGQWDTLVAWWKDGSFAGSVAAHDGDFFPEGPFPYVEAMRRWFTDAAPNGLFPPIRVDIDVTQECRALCTFCFSRRYQTSEYRRYRLGREEFADLASELASLGTRTIRFCGGGEPLVHPEIAELLAIPHQNGLLLTMISSCDDLTPELATCIGTSVDHLRFSMNAASDSLRSRIHRSGGQANLLSQTLDLIAQIVKTRGSSPTPERRPMIWATYLLLPENVHEIVEAARLARAVGIDSISFRPVFHGLDGRWDEEMLERRESALREAVRLDERPQFAVFAPKRRSPGPDRVAPLDHFSYCWSRQLRPVLEVTEHGLIIQSCGLRRGTGGADDRTIQSSRSFSRVWATMPRCHVPPMAPEGCTRCIDISINVTLAFIHRVLKTDNGARFALAKMS